MIADTKHQAGRRELVIKRTLDAPRALVWKAWTDPEQAKAWGPKGFTTPVREMEFRPGGKWRAVMISPDGKEYRQHGVVRKVVPEELLSRDGHRGGWNEAFDALAEVVAKL